MPLCFIEPKDAIRVIAESIGREARRQLLGEIVRAWVDEIPESELDSHYAKAVADLDEHDLSLLAAWHVSLEVGHPLPSKEFLVNVFPSLGENRREALKQITAPTMVIHGADDPLVPLAGGRDTAATIPGAKIVEIAGMGHNLPEPLIGEVLDAFEEVAKRATATA